MALEIVFLLPALALVVLANYTEKRRDLVISTQVLLLLLVAMVAAVGLLISTLDISEAGAFGFGMFITGLASLMFFLRNIRVLLAKFIPIDPDSWLHVTGLVFAAMLVGLSLSTAMSMDIKSLAGEITMDMPSMIVQAAFFVLLGLLAVGWLTRRGLKASLERLGLQKLTIRQFLLSLGFLGLIFFVMMVVSIIAIIIDPGMMGDADSITERLLGGRVTLLIALVVSLSAGIGEEVLFRGAVQPRFGIYLTAFIFAVSHVQYPNILALAVVLAAGIILGFERRMVNTTACVVTHSLFNFIQLALLAILSP